MACHPNISSSVAPFSSCPQSSPASGSFQMNQVFTSGGQCTGVSASASVLSMNIQGWFPLGWTGWISNSITLLLKHTLENTPLSSVWGVESMGPLSCPRLSQGWAWAALSALTLEASFSPVWQTALFRRGALEPFSQKWMKWACPIKKNNWQCLLPMIKIWALKEKNPEHWKTCISLRELESLLILFRYLVAILTHVILLNCIMKCVNI